LFKFKGKPMCRRLGWRHSQSVVVLTSFMVSTAWSEPPKIGNAWQLRSQSSGLERSLQTHQHWQSHYDDAYDEENENLLKTTEESIEFPVARMGIRERLYSRLRNRGGELSPTTKIQALHFVVTYAAYCAVYLARKPVSVVKPMLSSDLKLSTNALGIVDTSWLILYAVGQLSLGLARSLISSKTLLLIAFLFSGIFTSLCSIANTATSLAIFWGINGFFQASINPLLVLHIAELLPASARATGVGIWQTSQQVGGVCANLFAASTLRIEGWRAIFSRSGLLVALAGLPVFWLLANKQKKEEASHYKGSPPAEIISNQISDSMRKKKIYRSIPPFTVPGVKSTCVAYFLVKLTRYCLMFWLPLFLVKAAGYQVHNAARISALLDLGGVLGSVVAGLVADRLFHGAMISTCAPFAMATSVSLIILALAYDKGPSFKNALLLFSAGFFVAAPDGVLGGAAAKNIADYNANEDPKLPAAVSGFINGCGSIGAIVQGIGTAALVDTAGWSALFFCLAALMGLASITLTPAIQLEQTYLTQQGGRDLNSLPR